MAEYTSPEAAYLTKVDSSGNSNIGFTGLQAAATAAEVAARVEIAGRNGLATTTGGAIKLAR